MAYIYIDDYDVLEECDKNSIIEFLQNRGYSVSNGCIDEAYDNALLDMSEEKFKKFIIDYIKRIYNIHNDKDILERVKDIFDSNPYNYSNPNNY